jgi:predicted RNA-binding protein
MCEFTVILETDHGKKVVAKNIVKAKTKDGKVVLMDSLGAITKVEGAVILTVDTLMTELILRDGTIAPPSGMVISEQAQKKER